MDFLLTILGPVILEAVLPAVGTLAMTAIGFLALRYRALTGVEMDEKFKEALHGALMNALAGVANEFPGLSEDATVQKALKRVAQSNPGTLKHFHLDITSPVLMNIAMGLLTRFRPMMGPIGNALGDTLVEQVKKYPPSPSAVAAEARAAAVRAEGQTARADIPRSSPITDR